MYRKLLGIAVLAIAAALLYIIWFPLDGPIELGSLPEHPRFAIAIFILSLGCGLLILTTLYRKELKKPPDISKTEANTPAYIQTVMDYYDADRGILSSWWQRGKAEARTSLLTVLNKEQLGVIERGAILERAVQAGEKERKEYEVFLAQHSVMLTQMAQTEKLINQALDRGLTLETDQEVKRSQLLAEIELDKRWKEIVQDLNAADLVQMGDHQLLNKEREYLAQAIREKHRFLNSDEADEVKSALLPDIEQHIRFLQDRINARQTRLLSLEDGEETRRNQEATANSLRPAPKEIQATQVEVPNKRPRGRPRKTISD